MADADNLETKSLPFLLRFAITRKPQQMIPKDGIRYDADLAMTVIDGPNGSQPVINFADYAGARTKKDDIEKSEDQKDAPPRPRPPIPSPSPKPKP